MNTTDYKTGTTGNLQTATFAGGCFWCMEVPFKLVEGVVSVVSGYAGGDGAQPDIRAGGNGADRLCGGGPGLI